MPFVVIQVIMVLLVIFFPAMVMHYKGAASKIDPNKVKIELPQVELPPPLDFGRRRNSRCRTTHNKKSPGAFAPGLFRSGRSMPGVRIMKES